MLIINYVWPRELQPRRIRAHESLLISEYNNRPLKIRTFYLYICVIGTQFERSRYSAYSTVRQTHDQIARPTSFIGSSHIALIYGHSVFCF